MPSAICGAGEKRVVNRESFFATDGLPNETKEGQAGSAEPDTFFLEGIAEASVQAADAARENIQVSISKRPQICCLLNLRQHRSERCRRRFKPGT